MFGFFGPYKRPDPPKEQDPDPRYRELTKESLYRYRWEFIFNNPSVFEPVLRKDIVGNDHILRDLDRYVKLIQNFDYLGEKKAKLDIGLVFKGAPGSGKTFAGRYLASQSNARFIDISEFPRPKGRFFTDDIRELFGMMRQYVEDNKQPLIAFWDEFETFSDVGEDPDKIDALARFKTELSGIGGNLKGIFLIVATNKPHLIPSDITRPGRLGKIIDFGPLKRRAKQKVLEHFINRYEHESNIDFKSLSFLISAEYPAEIEELINEAWRNATMETLGTDNEACFTNNLLVATFIRQARGLPGDVRLDNEEIRAIAIYEIGRAIIARTLGFSAQLIALEKEGYSDAYRIAQEEHHSAHVLLGKLRDEIAVRYGGIIAQELCSIEENSKQIGDYMLATVYAQQFIEQFRATKISRDLSISALAKARTDQSLPSHIGIAENLMYETKNEIQNLLTQQQGRVRSIFAHYGNEFIEKVAKQLIDKGFLLQMDIDNMLDPNLRPDINTEKQEKRRPGF